MSEHLQLLLGSAAVLVLVFAAYHLVRGREHWLPRLRAALARSRERLPPRLRAALAQGRDRFLPRLRAALARGRDRFLPRLRAALARGRDRFLPRLRAALARGRECLPPRLRAALARGRARFLPRLREGATHAAVAMERARAALPNLRANRPALPSPGRSAPAVRKTRRVRVRPKSECTYPIVLAHGWMGVDALALPGVLRPEYFRGVREHLQAQGHCVHVSRVSPFSGIKRRAEQLAEQLEKIDAEKVNIIAHSMGGLDARYAITRLGMAQRVASLTTIGTPHHGTPLADTSAVLRELPLLRNALLSQLGLDFEGIHDLTTAQMATFNDTVRDVPGVRYTSYVGWVQGGLRDVHALLAPGFAYLSRRTGHNDGMVPAASQRWGQVLGDVHADHWAQIGWSRGLDAKSFYATVARSLAQSGL